jgi:hypothetical protein
LEVQIDTGIYIVLILGFIFSIFLDRYILKNEKIFLTTPLGLLLAMFTLIQFITGALRSKSLYSSPSGYLAMATLLSVLYVIQLFIYFKNSPKR